DRRPLLELAWRTLVRCQFHDAIAGCTSDDVARAVAGRLTSVEALAGDVVRGAVLDLVRHDPDAARERAGDPAPALVLWNPAARPGRTGGGGQGPVAREPLDRDRVGADGRAGAARPADRRAILRRAAAGGRWRRRRHVHLLSPGPGSHRTCAAADPRS